MSEALAQEFVLLQEAVIGRYSLERELGRGGMGVVFLARDVALDRPVAIKLLPPALAAKPGLRERFLREARTAAKLSQPNIVPIHDVEEAGELVFFVMSFVEGETLGERLRTKGPLTPHEAARLLQDVAWALGYAHGRGVVHRDIKPDNIMLERGTGRAVVMDFGIAGAAHESVGEVMGTAQYVSPEQANGDPSDGRSDLYSLGVVAFLALSGQLPFAADDVAGMLSMHITRPAPPLTTLAPGVPSRLARAVDRCLLKRPDDRFPNGEALVEAISGAVEQKRELPVPVRLWLTKGADQRGMFVAWYGIAGWPLSWLAGAGVGQALGVTAGVVTGALFYLGVPPLSQFLNRLYRLRRLFEAGYGAADVKLAVRQVAEQKREELAYEFGKGPAPWARMVYLTGWAAGGTMLLSFIGLLLSRGNEGAIGLVTAGSGVVLLLCRLINHVWPGRRITKDQEAELRLKFWGSRFASWFEKLARFKLKKRAQPLELTYRPTEMAIGLAADALFESLPKDQRKELKELPAVLQRLQNDAALMRRIVDELNGALAGLGEQSDAGRSSALAAVGDGRGVTDTHTRLRADLMARRDEAARRLADAVTALENVRLSLLKLKAGTGTVDELTADLTAARSLNDAIDRNADAQQEVEALLARTPS